MTRRDGEGTRSPAKRRRDGGPVVGVLMLDTRFPRFAGDIGAPDSLPYASRYRRIPKASVARVVTSEPLPPPVVRQFIDAGLELARDGVDLIVTSCGFLGAEQRVLANALPVPVITSSLVLLPLVYAIRGRQGPIGILTFDADALGPRHLGDDAAPIPLAIEGMQGTPHFHPVISEDRREADGSLMRDDVLAVARALARHRPTAVVLECTNLSPWRTEIREALGGVPVFDLHDAIACCVGAVAPGAGAGN